MRLSDCVAIWSYLVMIGLTLALDRYPDSLHEDDNIPIGLAQEVPITMQIAYFQGNPATAV